MPNSPARATRKPAANLDSPVSVAPEREPRGARRKRETRSRLLQAALKLMAERGMEGVAINEITEAADVGFGSFYNHFESKEAIYAALTDWVFEGFAGALDRLISNVTDPAEVVSVSVRHTVLRSQREPLWGQFLVREGFSGRSLNGGLARPLLRDIQKGIAAKRFPVADPLMAFISVGGTVLCAISVERQLRPPLGSETAALKELRFSSDNFPERTAAAVLQTLGLGAAEADRIAHRPLPAVEAQLAADGLDAPHILTKSRTPQSAPTRRRRGTRG